MKKLLCICMALILSLGVCAFAEEDLQAQLDAANEKIAELQAKVDAYYPYYAAQIVATYGEDGVIWLSDVQADYTAAEAQYAQYGISLASYGMEDLVKMDIVNSAVENAILSAKVAEFGLDQFDDDAIAEFEASADSMFNSYIEYYLSYYYPDEEATDETRAEAAAYWESNGMNRDTLLASLKEDAAFDALYEMIVKDVEVDEADIEATYQERIESNKADYVNDRTYNNDRNSGAKIAWNPEGYRAVKHVLVKFDDDQQQMHDTIQAQLTSLEAEREAVEHPDENADENAGENADEEAAEPRAIEEINADIAACATEMEALYSQLMPTAEEVIAAFDSGTDFDTLIERYNADPGMFNEPTASIGYAVRADSTTWESAFTDAAAAIANKGEISAPAYGSNGLHIIYYMDDIPAGEVALDEIRDDVAAEALEVKVEETYNDQVAAWVEEAGVTYYYSNFGIAE